MADTIVDLRMSRRGLIKLGGAAAVATTGAAGAMWPIEAQLKELEHQGWSRHPLACCMCGAFCGLVAMKKIGEPTSEKTVRIFPNPDHPQRGYCGRAAATMWIWNHPLRIRKPLKRVGERGEGKFKEVSWDEALNDIAAKLKDVVAKHGEQSIVSTSHSFSSYSKWITFPLGSPNDIGLDRRSRLGVRQGLLGRRQDRARLQAPALPDPHRPLHGVRHGLPAFAQRGP